MEIRDPVHGSIHIANEIVPIITHDFFKRLRNIKQLGLSEYVFPGATHTRFLHSIGVMFIGEKVFDKLFKAWPNNPELMRIRETFKLACLLHDVGHAPLSHATESVMPPKSLLQIPPRFLLASDQGRTQATHEDYTVKAITDSSFVEAFQDIEKKFGINRYNVAELIVGHSSDPDYFVFEGVNYFPMLHQLISSEVDCDRMDYLLRDSYFCGVSYGNFDLDWLIDNLESCVIEQQSYLGIAERAVVTFDDFLLSRFHMFLQVYFHYRSVCLEQLLLKYFQTAGNEYQIPASIEAYQEHDDHFLMKTLRNSRNIFAQAIVKNEIPPKVYESFNDDQLKVLESLENFLAKQKIDFIRSSSSGRISKYYGHMPSQRIDHHLKVVRTINGKKQKKHYLNINQSTDLFEKFSNSHSVNRLHCHLHQLNNLQQQHLNKIMEEDWHL